MIFVFDPTPPTTWKMSTDIIFELSRSFPKAQTTLHCCQNALCSKQRRCRHPSASFTCVGMCCVHTQNSVMRYSTHNMRCSLRALHAYLCWSCYKSHTARRPCIGRLSYVSILIKYIPCCSACSHFCGFWNSLVRPNVSEKKANLYYH